MNHPQLHLLCADPKVDLLLDMGDGPATPTAGYAGWEVVSRPRRKGMTVYTGKEPFQQDVPVLLDGLAEDNSVQRQLEAIESLGDEVVFRAYGPIHRPGILYVFGAEPEFGEVIRDRDGTLLRQALTLKLMEHVTAQSAGRHQKIGVGPSVRIPYTFTVRAGADTLIKVAQVVYGDWRRWKEIGQKNGISDGHRQLKHGRKLKL